ncbi:MAG: GNAT family N-acetyltransferase, partial [Gammaproteobacteria bacterium]|nr:GNAT family N-acetyltransferase [Gammaproteobacteria bacterium]
MSTEKTYSAKFINSIGSVDAADWNALAGTKYPFHRHEFLSALEDSNCISGNTGWHPLHLLLESDADSKLVAAMPMYQKNNSEGEFVFDFAWARAYHEAGLNYFPKLVAAIPFTPVTCSKILLANNVDESPEYLRTQLISITTQQAKQQDISSLHLLFPTEEEQQNFNDLGLLQRRDCQFHWRNDNYIDFDDFLSRFKSKKRKQVRRERRKVSEAGINYEIRTGKDMPDELWDMIAPLYSRTFLLRGRAPYLTPEFFKQLTKTLPESLVVIIGYSGTMPVATAICFKSDTTLYGRYWGSAGEYDSLHFET